MTTELYDFSQEADLEHDWAKRWRIPLVTSPCPGWKFEVALVVPPAEPNPYDPWDAVWPTDEEAEVIGSLIEYRQEWYNDRWKAIHREQALDVDSGTNTIILMKREYCWSFRRWTFHEAQPWPSQYYTDIFPLFPPTKAGLVAIIARANGGPDHLFYKFSEWMDANPKVWRT